MIKNKPIIKRKTISMLEQMIKMLHIIPVRRFEIENWVDYKTTSKPSKLPENFIKYECGTVACAIGWGTFYKPFVDQGLSRGGILGDTPIFTTEKGNIYYADDCVYKFLRISKAEAKDLFYGTAYYIKSLIEGKSLELRYDEVKPKHLINRLEILLRRYKAGKPCLK